MQLLLSGGTGFFGKALLRFWTSPENAALRPDRAFIVSRSPARFLRAHPEFESLHWIEWLTADIVTLDSLGAASLAARLDGITHVLHAATESTNGPALSHQTQFDQILQGTRTMLALAKSLGRPRFLITSSGGVYGKAPAGMTHIPEGYLGMPDPLEAKNAYSVAKRTSEHMCALAAYEHGLSIVVSRSFAFCGPDLPLDVHFAIGNFIRDALSKDEITVQGDGSPIRSYLDQDDLAYWLMTMLFHGKRGEAYNLGSDEGISIGDLAHKVRDLLAPNKRVVIKGTPNSTSPRQVYVPDIRKAREELGLTPTVSLTDSILRTARAHSL
jgi:UDP-glucuronate decarboxylase